MWFSIRHILCGSGGSQFFGDRAPVPLRVLVPLRRGPMGPLLRRTHGKKFASKCMPGTLFVITKSHREILIIFIHAKLLSGIRLFLQLFYHAKPRSGIQKLWSFPLGKNEKICEKISWKFFYYKKKTYICDTIKHQLNLYTMNNNIYTMVFSFSQDKEDFITCSKNQRRFKVIADIDRRTIRIQFRKGTKAERMFNLADLWNAEILWGKWSLQRRSH